MLPETRTGASRLTSPRSDDDSGATTPTTPGRLGDGEVEIRGADRVRRAEDLGDLVGPAGVPDPAVDGPIDDRGGPSRPGRPPPVGPRRRTGRGAPPSARRRGRGPGPGSSPSARTSRRTRRGRHGPRREGPSARPGRRSRGAHRRPPSRRTSGRSRSAGTGRRCRACTSCGPRPGASGAAAAPGHANGSGRAGVGWPSSAAFLAGARPDELEAVALGDGSDDRRWRHRQTRRQARRSWRAPRPRTRTVRSPPAT